MKLLSILSLIVGILFFACKSDTKSTSATSEQKISAEEKESLNNVLKNMQGDWVSVAGDYELHIEGDKFQTIKGGKVLKEEKFEFHEKCPGTCTNSSKPSDIFCFTLSDNSTTSCYLIRSLNKDSDMSYAGLAGNDVIYSFKKKK